MNDKTEIVDAEFSETAIVKQVPGSISVSRPPQIVLEEARQAAKALKEVIDSKPKKVEFNGQTYLEFEDWQTIARFYGVSCKVTKTEFVTFGDVKGFEARAVVLLVSNGLEISAADSMCLNDEENWGMRKRYEYIDILDADGKLIWEFNKKAKKNLPKRERKLVGEEPTPLFQLRSMAQTRACAKALRNVLAFVPVLAGYSGTPAEEMIQRGSQEAAQAVAQEKIKELEQKQESRKTNGNSTAKPVQDTAKLVRISYPTAWRGDALVTGGGTSNLAVALQMSLHGSKEPNGDWRVPGGAVVKFHDVCRESGIDVLDVDTGHVSEAHKERTSLPKIIAVKAGVGKAKDCVFVKWDGEEFGCWDKKLHPYLKAGVEADFEVKTYVVGTKSYHNIVRAMSIGDTKFDEYNKPVLDVNREVGFPESKSTLDEYLL